MISAIRIVLVALICSLSGCTMAMTVEDMARVFQDDVQESVGLTHTQLRKDEFHFIGIREPTEIRRLDNGNVLYVYGDYWVQYEIPRTPCDVYIEVEPATDKVVNAYAKGSGCYRPY